MLISLLFSNILGTWDGDDAKHEVNIVHLFDQQAPTTSGIAHAH